VAYQEGGNTYAIIFNLLQANFKKENHEALVNVQRKEELA
jgi:hypothetical protein